MFGLKYDKVRSREHRAENTDFYASLISQANLSMPCQMMFRVSALLWSQREKDKSEEKREFKEKETEEWEVSSIWTDICLLIKGCDSAAEESHSVFVQVVKQRPTTICMTTFDLWDAQWQQTWGETRTSGFCSRNKKTLFRNLTFFSVD